MEALSNRQKTYFDFFGDVIKRIDEIRIASNNSSNLAIHNSVCMSLLDSISKIFFDKNIGNGKKFRDNAMQHCNWSDAVKLEPNEILKHINSSDIFDKFQLSSIDINEIRKICENSLSRRYIMSQFQCDLDLDEITRIYKGSNKEFSKFLINKFSHAALLYSYRNNLVHELKTFGILAFDKNKDFPYHHKIHNSNESFIVYPPLFLRKLVLANLNSAKEFVEKSNLDPMMAYE